MAINTSNFTSSTNPSISLQTRFANTLKNPLPQRCVESSKLIQETMATNTKDIQTCFPLLVKHSFGCNSGDGNSNLNQISRTTNYDEYSAIHAFLNPDGVLFQLIKYLLADPLYRCEFPVSSLPAPSKLLIEEGFIPGFYASRIARTIGSSPPCNISLNAFEFYVFHFANFVFNETRLREYNIDLAHNQNSNPSALVYIALLEVYLEQFLPLVWFSSNQSSLSTSHQYNDLQSLLCATLQSVLRKMTPEDAPQISDAVMNALVHMFSSTGKTGGVQEDALMAVGTLVETLGEGFLRYMDVFRPYLKLGLENHAEHQVCSAAVGLVGDICRAIGIRILPYCDEIMNLLLTNLSNNSVHRSVKPQISSVFGDIALALGTEFKNYLDVVLTTLAQASQLQVDKNDYDLVDYLNDLRETCLEAYTGIVQGLKGDKEPPNPEVNLIQGHVQYMVQFIMVIASDPDITDTLVAACAGLIGDLCSAFGPAMVPLIDSDVIHQLLLKGKRSKASKTRTLSTWAIKESRKLKMSVTNPVSSTNPCPPQALGATDFS